MIRNVKDATALLDRRFGSATGRPWSIVRTLIWVLVGIYVIGLVLPAPKVDFQKTHYNVPLQGTRVRDLILDKNDPRGWQHVKKNPHHFTIAWVGGSSIQTVKPGHHGFLAVDTLHRLPKIDGKPVQVNMYLMESSRIYDLYVAVQDAIASKPDMIVLDVNPIWVFNPNAIQSWTNLNSTALSELISHPGAWPLIAAIDSPSDAALALADNLGAVRDRWSYAEKLHDAIDKLAPNAAPPKPATHLSGVELIATMQESLSFWNYYRLIPSGTPGAERYPAMMAESKTDGSVLNDYIVGQMFGALADSKIPSLAYMAAVDPSTFRFPGVDATLARIENHLQQIADQHRSPTLLVRSKSATRYASGMQFRDMVHMTYAAPVVDYLSKQICAELTTIDPRTSCTPKPTPTPPTSTK